MDGSKSKLGGVGARICLVVLLELFLAFLNGFSVLTHSCGFDFFVWNTDTFDNPLEIRNEFITFLKESFQ